MVQEYVSPVRVHKYSFEMVMAAYERRFPNCPQIPVVLECAISEDSWSSDNSQRHTNRRCQLNVDAPYLLKKMIGVDYIYFIQKNHLDLKGRVLEIEATNETFSSRIGVVEKCKYYVHPENPEWTCFEQSALLDVRNFFGLENTVEKIAMKQYAANIAKGKELIESFMSEVLEDGITELKPWRSDDKESNRYLRRIVSRGTEPLSPGPVAETKRHSQPGPSGKKSSSPPISKPQKPSRSNVKLSPENSRKSIPSKSAVKLSSSDLKRSSNSSRKSDRSQKSVDQISEAESLSLASKSLDNIQTKLRKANEEEIREGKRVTVSQPDLRSLKSFVADSEDSLKSLRKTKPCTCEQRTLVTVSGLFTRWDNLLVVLVGAMVIVLIMSAPLTFFFGRRRGNS